MSNQQVTREPLKYCSVCGSVLLKYVDFENNNPEIDICCNCRNIDPRTKNIVNASFNPLSEKNTLENNDNKTNDKLNIFYSPNGKPSIDVVQLHYNPKITEEIKQIVDDSINVKPLVPNPEEKPLTPYQEQQNKIKSTGKIKIDWSRVIGYEDIKRLIDAAINSQNKKRIHVLLVGAPGTSKTVFLMTIKESMEKQGISAHYLDATTLTSSGVIEYLFTHDNIQFCLLDELDKLSKEHQATFLNTFETGILQETKGSISKKNPKIRRKDMSKTTFIVTANYEEKILKPLLTRMMTLRIKEYTKEQFYKIGVQLLHEQYNKTEEIAYYIVDKIYRIYTEIRKEKPNLRYCRDVAILTDNNKHTIDPIINALTEYSVNYNE